MRDMVYKQNVKGDLWQIGEFHIVIDLGYSSKILQLCALRNNYFSNRLFSESIFLLSSSLSYNIGNEVISWKARK